MIRDPWTVINGSRINNVWLGLFTMLFSSHYHFHSRSSNAALNWSQTSPLLAARLGRATHRAKMCSLLHVFVDQ